MVELVFVTEQFVRDLHDDILEADGGLPGEYANRLSSALGAVETAYAYGRFDTPLELAAYYGHSIGYGHCFNDGNKRTALQVLDSTLLAHGLDLKLPQVEIAEMMEGIASGIKNRDDLITFLRRVAEDQG